MVYNVRGGDNVEKLVELLEQMTEEQLKEFISCFAK
jgi:hypothetical protein